MTPSPQFRLVAEQPPYRSFAEALAALWETESPVRPVRLGPGGPWPRDRRPVPAFVASVLIHLACAFFLYSVPLAWLVRRISGYPIPAESERHYSVVIYHLQSSDLADYLPLDLSPGPGGTPGRGAPRPGKAMRGSNSLDPRVSIVSQPKTPDNFHQTILQPSLPPNLRITQDFPLPDLVIKSLLPAIEPPMPPPPPKAAPAMLQAPIMPAITERLPVRPTGGPIAPAQAELVPRLAQSLVMPAALLPPPPDQPAPAAKQTVATATSPPGELLSLSVNPAPLKELLILPAGNREGAFSISAAGGQEGSTGGATSGNQKAGTTSGHSLGDLSISRGPGISGGAGGSGSSGSATASISGGAEGTRALAAGSLTPLNAEALVYPVDSRLRLRGAALVVSTGPGGGGLDVYGMLHGSRIYTVYLVMAPRNWILQFCVPEQDPPPEQPARLVRLQLEPPLTPPAAVEKFDFHRPALLSDKASGMIILRGLIEKSGSVAKLRLVRGVEALADQAALAAFGRWKFSPALRGGKPVAVEILVGIPARP